MGWQPLYVCSRSIHCAAVGTVSRLLDAGPPNPLSATKTPHLVGRFRNRIKEGTSNTRSSVDVTSSQKAVKRNFGKNQNIKPRKIRKHTAGLPPSENDKYLLDT